MDIKRVLELIESAEQQKQSLTEGKNMAKEMVMQHYTKQEIKTPIKRPVNRLNEYFKVVDNEMLNVIKEEQDAKRVEVKKIVNRVLERLDEGKKVEAPKPRNFVAKNQQTSGAGAHKDKKKAEKQGDVKHKKQAVPMDEDQQLDEKAVSKAQQRFMGMVHAAKKGENPASKEVAKVAKGMSAKAAKDFAKTKHKGLPDKKDKKTDEGLEDPKDNPCWKGYKPVGTKKKGGKTVPNCVPKESIEVGSTVRVYSNVLKKPVLGTVVQLKEGKAYVNYANTKIVMGHPVEKVQLSEVAGLARFIPGVGLVAGGYDAYQRAKQGDWGGAAMSAGAGLAGLVPGIGTAAQAGLIGAQMGRDKARTGSFLPSYDEIGAAGKPAEQPAQAQAPAQPAKASDIKGQAAQTAKKQGAAQKQDTAQSATPAAEPQPQSYNIAKGDNLTKIAKKFNTTVNALMKANPQIKDPNKIFAGAKLNLPGQRAAPAPGANVPNPAPQPAAATPAPNVNALGIAQAANVANPLQPTPQADAATGQATQQAAEPTAAQSATPAPSAGANSASITDRTVTQQPTTTTKQGNVTTTTSGSSASGTLKGITQDMIVNHPVYKAEMAKAAGKSPQQVQMARDVAAMNAKAAILKDPSYLQNYQAPAAKPTGNSKVDNF
jgi:LysM repeat protein